MTILADTVKDLKWIWLISLKDMIDTMMHAHDHIF